MKKLTILMSVLIIALFSCGPSIEGESKSWKSNVAELEQLKKDYPTYAEIIKTTMSEAEKVYSEAQGISNEDEKADKMREANNLLSSGCVGNLKNMKSKIADVEKSSKELKGLKQGKDAAGQILIKEAIKDGKKAKKKALKVLNVSPEDAGTNPCDFVNNAYQELESAIDDIKNQIENIKEKEKDKQAEETKIKEKEKKDDTPKQIECGHCGKKNKAGKTECKYCGAPL